MLLESRTPALTSDEAKSFTSSGRDGGQPTIASPKEQGSLGEGSVGVAAGDPAGGANVVSAAKAAGRGLLVSTALMWPDTITLPPWCMAAGGSLLHP